MFPEYTIFSSCWLRLNFCRVVALDPSMFPTTLAHCLNTLSNYGSGREPCTAKAFSPRLGVLSGFVFQRHSPGDTTLSEHGQTKSVLQGWHRFTTIGLQIGLQLVLDYLIQSYSWIYNTGTNTSLVLLDSGTRGFLGCTS
jgi:hypothetical protein